MVPNKNQSYNNVEALDISNDFYGYRLLFDTFTDYFAGDQQWLGCNGDKRCHLILPTKPGHYAVCQCDPNYGRQIVKGLFYPLDL